MITVGMGATRFGWSDRSPFTVVEVLSQKRVVVQEDNAERIDNNGAFTESQQYTYTPDPTSRRITITLRKNGRWYEVGESMKGTSFMVGNRDKHVDPHF